MGYLRQRQTSLGAFDLQEMTRQFPRTVPLGSIPNLVGRALTIVSTAAVQTLALPSDSATMARTNLDKVVRGMESVGGRASALLRAGASPQSPAPSDLMADLRKWSLQAFIEWNAIAEGNDTMAQAQRAFWSDLADEARKVATTIVQAPAKVISTALAPLSGTVILIGLAIGLGLYLSNRRGKT